MAVSNGFFYHILAFTSCVAFIYFSFRDFKDDFKSHFLDYKPQVRFVEINGTQFVLDGKPFYVNGWNSYWLMDQAVDESTRPRVNAIFRTGAQMGLTVCRTWAFNDGTYNALQISPGLFDERVFQALDRVIAEAGRHGIRLILSLANNLDAYGGKSQYVKWAWEDGVGLSSSNDSFFFDPSIKRYFKSYLKTVLTRRNHISGVQYKDDPTIFAWELMNEPRCTEDSSGRTLQNWIEEMSKYTKSIDQNHLLTVGLEGFYGPKSPPEKLNINPGEWYGMLGADFIRNNKIPTIDFASVHVYPDSWLVLADITEKENFVSKWVKSHIEDGDNILKKPVLFTEFGLSSNANGFDHSHRLLFYKSIFDTIYESAKKNGAGSGAFVWQLIVEGMEVFHDSFAFIPESIPSLHSLLKEQSCRLATLRYGSNLGRQIFKNVCE
ncbi:hypothetical protein LUZ62_033770 [Rhynchospora pubera]|uniref:mannan endo-1,4-beta-mannosidase n=1 Tax=Rhynchospora pubera TaxID=906938 RepID=A0AAV8HUI0_9POAL|nr:hypothetical protein LUZ62_033770 [Rhynchospora pubera]